MRIIKLVGTLLVIVVVAFVAFNIVRQRVLRGGVPDLPVSTNPIIENHEWANEELITIQGYEHDAMEIGISPGGEYLLFNDRHKKPDKDIHWASRVNDTTYRYEGTVENTVTPTVDATPEFDGLGNLFYTTLKSRPQDGQTMYRASWQPGVAVDPQPVEGDIYVQPRQENGKNWISLDPDVSADGRFLFYSEGLFGSAVFPYPFNVRGAELVGDEYKKISDELLANVNSDQLEYAPAISDDGLELFFTRIERREGDAELSHGIYVTRRDSIAEPFNQPERITAITGFMEAPVLSGDEQHLYYHRMHQGRFQMFRVRRK